MSQLFIDLETPLDDSSITICNTVTVSGTVSDNVKDINIVVTGATVTCNSKTDSSGWFSCVLANLPDDSIEINAVDDNGNYEPGVANVTTDSSECLFQPAFSTQPSSRQAASAAIHPTYTFSKVPEKIVLSPHRKVVVGRPRGNPTRESTRNRRSRTDLQANRLGPERPVPVENRTARRGWSSDAHCRDGLSHQRVTLLKMLALTNTPGYCWGCCRFSPPGSNHEPSCAHFVPS